MKINVGLVFKLRTQKSWSQEELAIASGLNLRTIQRVECEASASLQSTKALAVVETNVRKALQAELDHAGAQGWELVSATSMFNTIRKKLCL